MPNTLGDMNTLLGKKQGAEIGSLQCAEQQTGSKAVMFSTAHVISAWSVLVCVSACMMARSLQSKVQTKGRLGQCGVLLLVCGVHAYCAKIKGTSTKIWRCASA